MQTEERKLLALQLFAAAAAMHALRYRKLLYQNELNQRDFLISLSSAQAVKAKLCVAKPEISRSLDTILAQIIFAMNVVCTAEEAPNTYNPDWRYAHQVEHMSISCEHLMRFAELLGR
jgi:hypothetical protein